MSRTLKIKNSLQLTGSLIVIVLAAYFLNLNFFRIDLTSEKRYTLSDNTLELLRKQEKDLYFQIFLAGELPPGFVKLQKSVQEILDEFNVYAEGKIHYELINPLEGFKPKERGQIVSQLVDRGLQPTNLQEKSAEGGLSQKLIFPGVIVHDQEKETTVNLLKKVNGVSSESNLNHSIESLEYELTMAIRMLNATSVKRIAFLTGHQELNRYEVADFSASLSQHYEVCRISTEQLRSGFDQYKALVIAQPRKEFSETDKYIIDQYVMNGGRVLWLVDEVVASMDSLSVKESTFAYYQPLNIEDQLFRYGVRVNPDLVMDAQCALVPVLSSLPGEPSRYTPGPWYYSPLFVPLSNHTITRNLNQVKGEFTNSIDTVGRDGRIRKTILLKSSKYTRLEKVPTPVSLDVVRRPMNAKDFGSGAKSVAVLLEGEFSSVFQNRKPKGIDIEHREESVPTRMIVVADGDMVRNRVRGTGSNRQIEALGYDRYSRQTYGNRKFLLNCINYLCDDEGWMDLRSKEMKLRLLDKTRIRESRLKWQLFNMLLPVAGVLLWGVFFFMMRKRKYTR
ncbi:MAG: gliding motility-associated ABC transporter substrate-binding protein GldG [Marinifilaceae bacterium]